MIEKKENNIYREYDSLLEALNIAQRRDVRLCAAGAGGKTSIIKRLAFEYRKRGTPVVVTTTTHMRAEKEPFFLLERSGEKTERILKEEGMVFLGRKDRDGKMKMPEKEWMEEILAMPCPVLIEADGAKCLPMKVPEEWEPVFPPETTHVIYVYGMKALGEPMDTVCFRAEKAAELLGKSEKDVVREEDIAALAVHPRGAAKGVQDGWNFTVAMGQADLPGKGEAAERIGRMIPGDVLICKNMQEWRK